MKSVLFALFCWICMPVLLLAQSVTVTNLSCEHQQNPLGIDVTQPRLSWQLQSDERNQYQSAYEIKVMQVQQNPQKQPVTVWSSGKVKSNQNFDIPYKGRALKPFTRYTWQVRVYNQQNMPSEWSEPADFETAMLKAADWKGKWISDGKEPPQTEEEFYQDRPAPLFRKAFEAKKAVHSARLYIAGLGYYDAFINGQPVSDQWLNPGWTNFSKQILYSTFDVTHLIEEGENAIGVMLGNGFYNPLPMRVFKPLREYLSIGEPCLKAQLRIVYTDGSESVIVTDGSWQTAEGPVLRNNVYLGEHYDARKEIPGWSEPETDEAAWNAATLPVKTPRGKLTAQMQPPVRVTKTLHPVRMAEVRPGVYVVDMGQNFAGIVRLKMKGEAGQTIAIRYGEDIYSDGSLNVMTSVAGQQKKIWNANWDEPGQPQTAWQEDRYTLKGSKSGEIWSPRFTFHGFRFIEITGWPGRPSLNDIEGLRMNADLSPAGTFACSNDLLNDLHQVCDNTFLSNVFSVQSDCPAREKFGYGGDIVGVARSFCWMYDMNNFYRKAVQDFANDQRPSGGMTETAPYNGIADQGLGDNSGPIGWQLAFAFMQKQLYDYYGDLNIIRANYPALVKQVKFLQSKAKNHLIETCINDHESLEERIPELFATAHYYHHVQLLSEFAGLLGKNSEKNQYNRLAGQIKNAFIANFVNTEDGVVGNQTQAAQAFALYYDLIPEGGKELVLEKLLARIEQDDYHVQSGIFGIPALLTVLSDNNRNDVACKMVTQETFPGWGFMLESGATTLWETWAYSDNVYSQNHPMFGSVIEWMYQSAGGIKSTGRGFREFRIKPQPADELNEADCSYESVNGTIRSAWESLDDSFTLEAVIPVNTTATICIPSGEDWEITENHQPVESVPEIKFAGYEEGYNCFKVGSGKYSFRAVRP